MANELPSTRPVFDPVDTSADSQQVRDDVESPSLSSSNALARFEFEPGRNSKDGTKVLMVEWEEDDVTRAIAGDWEISWEGKRTTLPARDPRPSDAATSDPPTPSSFDESSTSNSEQPVNRLYFLLGPGVSVPTAVRLQKGSVTWRTNPLPAIFAPELGATARTAGKKGVLHTVWAKKRLQVLQREIEQESLTNAEGIGLEMAVAEKEWIEQNFGVVARPGSLTIPSSMAQAQAAANNVSSPASPRSPGGGRLMDKLKGLKLGTSERQLRTTSNGGLSAEHNPLSPESSDVAVSGFSSFSALKGDAALPSLSSLAAKPAQPPAATATATATATTTTSSPPSQQQQQQQPSPALKRMFAAQRPPDAALWQPQQGMGSLNAFASGDVPPNPASGKAGSNDDDDDDDDADDDLFALPMSPRSPEMAKSPFSFVQKDAAAAASVNGRSG